MAPMGVAVFDYGAREGVLGFAVFSGHDDGEAEEAVLETIHRADGFSFGGFGACAFLRVGPVGCELFV